MPYMRQYLCWQGMQSALDAKAFASITDNITQLLLLREVLCTSELSATTTAGEALQGSATPKHRASGACKIWFSVEHPLYADAAWIETGYVASVVSICMTQAAPCPA